MASSGTGVIDVSASPILNEDSFSRPSYDLRYCATSYSTINPCSGIHNCRGIRFICRALEGPNTYDLSNAFLAVSLKLTNKAGTGPPPKDLKASVTNNLVFSLFSGFRMNYGQVNVVNIPDFHLASYLNLRLTTSDQDLSTWCYPQCFVKDVNYDNMDPEETGFQGRREFFGAYVKEGDPAKDVFEYSVTPTFLMAKITSYVPSSSLLPRDTDIILDFDYNSRERVLCAADKNADINFHIDYISLIVPIVRMSDAVFLSLQEQIKEKPMRHHFLKLESYNFSMAKGSRSFSVDSLSIGK